jgi:DNA-binding transcriptional regulator YiaG
MAYIITMTPKELKQWRTGSGYSQGKLAESLSVHIMTLSRWERGVREIPSFLHLALRCLELEGGEPKKGKTTKKRRTKQ